MLVSWMISSNATEATINFFLMMIWAQNPRVIPKWFMLDFDRGQLNAIRHWYPESWLLLCWWHVAHAWQQHFVISLYPELWEKLKSWYHITDEAEFQKCWAYIQELVPKSFIEYIKTYWLPVKKLWSAIHCKNHTVFEQSDTNMLVEAWVIFISLFASEAYEKSQMASIIEGENAWRQM